MILQFFCRIVECVSKNEYLIEIDFANKTSLPMSNITRRRVYCSLSLPKDQIIFVSESKIDNVDDVKKLTILKAFSLTPLTPQQEEKSKQNLENSLLASKKEMIMDPTSFPLHVLS
jgi:hypothetical protein